MINNVPDYKRSMAWRKLPFWERVDSEIEPVPESGCHIFTGGCIGNGYGIAHEGGKHRLIHRAMWERIYGQIPNGMMVLHKCDVPACVNPSHLFLGTALDNNRDREAKGRGGQVSGASHCRPLAKLSEADVASIRKILATDTTHGICMKLARQYGVSASTISSVRYRGSWTHVK